MPLRLTLIIILPLLFACSDDAPPAAPAAAFLGSDACRDCHQNEYSAWVGSHHDLAMQVASAESVLADFSDATFQYFDTETRFDTRDGNFFVTTEDDAGAEREFQVKYTFGVDPLQQYLVETDGGRLQALPFTWDARTSEAGGQRWYHLYPDEYIGPGDVLFWMNREQNWNFMCAECHSTDVQLNYDVASDRFNTTWSEIDVGCEGCHGPGAVHVHQAELGEFSGNRGLEIDLDDHGRAIWQLNLQTGIAERSELLLRPPLQPEACGRCHARRGAITSTYEYGRPLADTHRVSLLDAPLYFDDGQIREEVYVYGSFLQSRMYAAGVTCSDCHDPHSARLITGANPNDVCSQCHLPDRFASREHTRHEPADAACVDCHMTSRTYMGVDERRDHSFRIPRPDLTEATGAPNACNACHDDRDAGWASEQVTAWRGTVPNAEHYAVAFSNARGGFANDELIATLGNPAVPGIARGTALTLLSPPFGAAEMAAIRRALGDGDAQVRVGALQALRSAPGEPRVQLAMPLLADPIRSVRIEAADLLAPAYGVLPTTAAASFKSAADEFRQAQHAIASRPEAHASLGQFEAELGNAEVARGHYEQSLLIEADAPVTRVNYADALRRFGDEANAEAVLREGIRLDAANAGLRHSLGLLLARTGRSEAALAELRSATELQPDSSRYRYVLAIALNSNGESDAAVAELSAAMQAFPGDFDIAWAMATISRDRGDIDRALEVARQLAERYPDNPDVRALVNALTTP